MMLRVEGEARLNSKPGKHKEDAKLFFGRFGEVPEHCAEILLRPRVKLQAIDDLLTRNTKVI